ncbi:MAG TPA: hypothetical protein VLX61_10410 [Anaerolineales bacterium]|nr:hypothetical protein [Anaerolineales bacterium]
MLRRLMLGICLACLLASCRSAPLSLPSTPTKAATTEIPPPPTSTVTLAPYPSDTPPPTETATPSTTPTFAILRGTVLETSNCRYGPGAPYLYFTGLVAGSHLEVIGRREDSQWLYVQAIGGHKPCWVKASQMDVPGDINSLEIYYPDLAPLPQSPFYPPTAVTKVVRNGTQVKVTWLDIPLHPGDAESPSMQHYIIEVWHCVGGQIVFDPLATNDTSVTFADELGCSQSSHGRIFVQEKHGFAGPADIPWPPYTTAPMTATP